MANLLTLYITKIFMQKTYHKKSDGYAVIYFFTFFVFPIFYLSFISDLLSFRTNQNESLNVNAIIDRHHMK